MNSLDYFSIESNGLTFFVPVHNPFEGIMFDPMRISASPEGIIKIPGLFPENEELTAFRLDARELVSLGAARAVVERFLRLYEPQFKGTPIVEQVILAMELYDHGGRRLRLAKSHSHIKTLLAITRWIGGPAITDTMLTAGRVGKCFDPRPMAKALFVEVSTLDYDNMPSIRRMIVEMVGHKAVLELGRRENQEILNTFVADLTTMLNKDQLFEYITIEVARRRNKKRKVDDHYEFSSKAYNRGISRLEQAMAPVKRLWGTPYTQLSLGIRNEINAVIYSLRAHQQERAWQEITGLIKAITRWGSSLTQFRSNVLKTNQSQAWQGHKFVRASRQFDKLTKSLSKLPKILGPFASKAQRDCEKINNLLIKREWNDASERLHQLADQCLW